MKKLYLYHNPSVQYQYKIIANNELVDCTAGRIVVLSASYVRAESDNNLVQHYSSNGSNICIAESVYTKEITNPDSGGYVYEYSFSKRMMIENITKISTNGTWSDGLLGGEFDVDTVLVANGLGGIIFTKDYGEAANALHLSVPYVFLIPEDELERYNYNPYDYRGYHIKRVKKLEESIKDNVKI